MKLYILLNLLHLF